MFRVTKKFGLEVIHVHYAIPHATSAFLAREITGIPYVVTLHGSDVTILGSDSSYMPINVFTIDGANAITAVSGFLAKEAYERLGIKKEIMVIPNFVDVEIYAPARASKKRNNRDVVITHISNFRPVKRIQDIVHALNIVVKQAPDAKLLLVGDGPERHAIERLIDKLGLKHNIMLTGYRSDISNVLKCSDIVVLSSETESAPLTLLEGMSTGLPVIATRVGGIPEIVEDGLNGFLVEPKHPEALAQKILELNSNEKLRERIGADARKRVLEKYTAAKIVSRYVEVYENVASSH